MSPLEEELLNLASAAIHAAAGLVAQKNPAYDNLIVVGQGLVDQINAQVNPSAAPAAQQIASAASALGSAAASAPAAVAVLTNKSATATQKASAVGIIVGDIESVGASILAFFHHPAAPAQAAASAAPAPAGS